MKKLIALLAALMILLAGCAAPAAEPTVTTAATTEPTTAPTTEPTGPKDRSETRLAILLPEEEKWAAAGEDLLMLLQNYHYQVEVYYAEGDGREQASQLEGVLSQGVDGVIIAPVESASLTEVFEAAQELETPVFAYDRLLMDTEAVGYYVSFDYRQMGAAIARKLIEASGLDTMSEGTLTVEFFMGSPEDSAALMLYLGIMDQLQPYLEQGLLVSRSGRTAFEDTCVQDWDSAEVQERLSDYLKEYYKKDAPDILCTVSDGFAAACLEALTQRNVKTQPLITGLGGDEDAINAIADGKQLMSIATDMYQLNEQLVETVDAVMTGKEPQLNDLETCHNNAKVVPAYLCDFEILQEMTEQTQPTESTSTEPA